ncbi:ABC transporter substrate-binding protein [Xanthobacter dioxanivorans]|uniref:ABC transporter substrate-binding protein n=1 Tax=Xanthobacter dioxanivorans TaxID=2528964 RepID=A0A974SKQ4_9HYPH|nr:ABC transporter substrate-binding protein [Xanthobacter dioxanivorans]QRG09085.1 ABC transporter substrate-binding protein [Xanthobacter dioxanivorans]
MGIKFGISRRTALMGMGATALAASTGTPLRAQTPPTLRYATGGGFGPNEIDTVFFTDFMKKNILKRYGKDYLLDVTYTRGTPEATALMAAGRIDLAAQSCASFVSALAKDAVPGGMKVIADEHDVRAGYSAQSFYVLEGSPITDPKQLKGKIIAVNAFGTGVDLLLRVVLKKNGLDPRRDVRIVEISFPSIGMALREGRVDCGVLPLPFGATELAKGGIRELFNGTAAYPAYSVIFQAATNQILTTQPAAVRAWLADYVDGLHWLHDPANRKEAVAVVAEVAKSTPEVVDTYFATKSDYYRDLNGCLSSDLLQSQVDAMVDQGFLAKRIEIKNYVDMSYLPHPCAG